MHIFKPKYRLSNVYNKMNPFPSSACSLLRTTFTGWGLADVAVTIRSISNEKSTSQSDGCDWVTEAYPFPVCIACTA